MHILNTGLLACVSSDPVHEDLAAWIADNAPIACSAFLRRQSAHAIPALSK